MKKLLIILLLLPVWVWAASEGPNSPSAATGQTEWTKVDSVFASDNKRADNPNDLGNQDILRAYTFGFSIPAGATIDGFTVGIEGYGDEPNVARRDFEVSLGVSGYTPSSDWKVEILPNPAAAESTLVLGGASDTWNWSGVDSDSINSTDFSVLIRDADAGYGNHLIDHVEVTVNYTAAGGGVYQGQIITIGGD